MINRRELLKLIALSPLALRAGQVLMKEPEKTAPAPPAPKADGKLRYQVYGKHSSITFETAEDDEVMRKMLGKLAVQASKSLDAQVWGNQRLMG
jgi:hypothetical protein